MYSEAWLRSADSWELRKYRSDPPTQSTRRSRGGGQPWPRPAGHWLLDHWLRGGDESEDLANRQYAHTHATSTVHAAPARRKARAQTRRRTTEFTRLAPLRRGRGRRGGREGRRGEWWHPGGLRHHCAAGGDGEKVEEEGAASGGTRWDSGTTAPRERKEEG